VLTTVDMTPIGKMFVMLGGIIVAVGVLLMFFDKIPYIGKLPGDISIKKGNFQFYFPITTSILLSIILSVILWLISSLKGK
jgi:hypothetical protein